MDLNQVTLIGRLTKDVDVRYTTQGTAIGRMSIACNRMKKDEVDYFDVEVWGKMAENLKSYLVKGKQIAIVGRLKQDRWTGQDGKAASRVGIVAEHIQLIGGVKSDGQSQAQPQEQGYQEVFDPWADGNSGMPF
jgi:single-strand DNA-binding protein